MRISRVGIEGFGLWRDLDLRLNPHGLSVICGPNEAGKTTLLRFVRGMLYGFPQSELIAGHAGGEFRGGSLHVLHGNTAIRITRRRDERGDVGLSVGAGDRTLDGEETLQELLAGTSRALFQNVFAVGLHELQQLAALQSEEIAERMYGVSLGSDGRRLLAALQATAAAKRELFDPADGSGRLASLLQQDARLSSELDALGSQREDYDRMLAERQRVDDSIAEMKSRQAGMLSQLRGHQFMRRVHAPWRQVCEFEDQLAELPGLGGFPEDGLERLRQLEEDLHSDQRCRQALRAEIDQLEARRRELLANRQLVRHAGVLRRIVKRRDRIAAMADAARAAENRVQSLQETLETQCRELGPEWTRERLAEVDVSPESQLELLRAARRFQAAIVRRGRFRKLFKAAERSFRKLEASWGRHSCLPEPGRLESPPHSDETLESAVERETRALQAAEDRRRLQNRIADLEARLSGRNDWNDEPDDVLPKWFRRVLWTFTAAGGVVALLGLATIFTLNAWAGLVLALSGLTGLGVSRGIQYFQQSEHAGPQDNRKTEAELAQAKAELQRLQDEAGDADAELAPVVHRLVRWDADRRMQRRVEKARRRMVELRNRNGSVRQEFGQARQDWCDAQALIGLEVRLKPDDVFAHFEAVWTAKTTCDELWSAEKESRRLRERCERRLQRIRDIAAGIGEAVPDDRDPLDLLDDWSRRLEGVNEDREEARRLKEDIRVRRREAKQFAGRLKELKREYATLLEQGGAADREEFEQNAEAWARRAEIAELLELANEELREAAASEPELAIVEEDLQRFDPEENDGCIHALETEIADINADLQRAHEELGGVKQAIAELESDRRASGLRFDRAQLECELVDALTDWQAEQLVDAALESLKARLERERQPAVLARASEFLRRLTGRRYDRVWTPLGRRRLRVDDAHRDTWGLDDLSGGTREQVFLALRLALIEEFVAAGIELPVLLDDVLVNFDGRRTEAAVAALKRMAEDGRQIIFLTCHDHIAEQFRRHGVQPIDLPTRDEPSERRLAG